LSSKKNRENNRFTPSSGRFSRKNSLLNVISFNIHQNGKYKLQRSDKNGFLVGLFYYFNAFTQTLTNEIQILFHVNFIFMKYFSTFVEVEMIFSIEGNDYFDHFFIQGYQY